jgi:23S rRNA (uracil1939-C5)-methyltransferase
MFYAADLHSKEIPALLNEIPKPDIIIIDPPRAGMHQNLVNHILKMQAERIIYVSCNPATQARDCALLAEKYEPVKIAPVDMFPHTYHVESIAELKLNK